MAFKRLVLPWEAKMQSSWCSWRTGLATAFITLFLWKSALHWPSQVAIEIMHQYQTKWLVHGTHLPKIIP